MQKFFVCEKYRKERSRQIYAVCDITSNSISVLFYDTVLSANYARACSYGEPVRAESVADGLAELLTVSMRQCGIPPEDVKKLGIASEAYIQTYLERKLGVGILSLTAACDIVFVPYISPHISGRFTAMLLTLPQDRCSAAYFGKILCAARVENEKISCFAVPMTGAFDGSGLENGLPAEEGAVNVLRFERDGMLAYEVIGDKPACGISPCGALTATALLTQKGVIDADGIMTDRDFLYIGEDFFLSQADVRAVQTDKARSAAALSLLSDGGGAFFAGEPFCCSQGIKAMIEIGAVPEKFSQAAFCRNSVPAGVLMCLRDSKKLENAYKISHRADDITEQILAKFDRFYLNNLTF